MNFLDDKLKFRCPNCGAYNDTENYFKDKITIDVGGNIVCWYCDRLFSWFLTREDYEIK
jgi:uncharacterized Zn-finger protein